MNKRCDLPGADPPIGPFIVQRPLPRSHLPTFPPAFTLVELLVVIVVISILIGLLVPAVGAVRRIGRETASKSVLTAIETGLEMYKANEKLGGSYPPSASDATGSPLAFGNVYSPFVTNQFTPIGISGAGLLVWALSGADSLGTPGFRDTRNNGLWSDDTGKNYDPSTPPMSGLYALNNSQQPAHPRYGPFIDLSKVKMTRNEGTADQPNFVIPAEREALGGTPTARPYPMYLDGFGYPVLYWRADPAGRYHSDWSPIEGASQNWRGIYHCADNGWLVGSRTAAEGQSWDSKLELRKDRQAHALGCGPFSVYSAYDVNNQPPAGTFQAYIRNMTVQARLEPHRPDSYLLITPGADARYGTADDVANFQHNGQ